MPTGLITVPLPDFRPVTNITPFTVRDGITFLGKFEALRYYVTNVLVPAIDAENAEIEAAWEEQITFLTNYINQAIEAIINDSVDIQDPVVAEMVNDPESLSRQALDDLYAAKSIQDAIETGRLSEATLNATYAAKSVETTITSGRLSEASLDADYGSKTDVDALKTLTTSGRLSDASLDADYAPKSLETTINSGRLSEASLDAAFAGQAEFDAVEDTVNIGRLSATQLNSLFGSGLVGVNGRKYKAVLCALRNDGTGWNTIEDSAHRSTNVTSVTQDSTAIILNYAGIAANRVVSLSIVPDETFAGTLEFGASVGLTDARISIRRRILYSDYITYDGSAWTSQTGRFAVTAFSAGVATLTHANVFNRADGGSPLEVHVTGRDGASAGYRYQVASSGIGNTITYVAIRDNSGTLLASPTNNIRFFIDRGLYSEVVNPSDVNTNTGYWPNSNIWVFGVFEIA
jgi:hypothetical protein